LTAITTVTTVHIKCVSGTLQNKVLMIIDQKIISKVTYNLHHNSTIFHK